MQRMMQRIDEQPQSRASTWALRLAVFLAALVAVTIACHRLFTMPTAVALNLFMLTFAGAVLVILLAIVALTATWSTGIRGGAAAVAAIAIGSAILAWPAYSALAYFSLPVLNDVTTDTASPPQFVRLAALRPKGANDPAYPGAKAAARQQVAYGDVAPLFLARRPEDSYELVLEALRRQKMTIVSEVREPGGGGLVEAIDRTLVLGFADDLAVRVMPDGRGARVDVRSASRFGRHDLGRNAERVRRVLQQVVARAQATVPATPGERVARARANARKGKPGAATVKTGGRAQRATPRAGRSQIQRDRRRPRAADE